MTLQEYANTLKKQLEEELAILRQRVSELQNKNYKEVENTLGLMINKPK